MYTSSVRFAGQAGSGPVFPRRGMGPMQTSAADVG